MYKLPPIFAGGLRLHNFHVDKFVLEPKCGNLITISILKPSVRTREREEDSARADKLPDKLLGHKWREDGEEEFLLPLVLLLGPVASLQGPAGLQESFPLGPLCEILGVGAAPVDCQVEDGQGHQGVDGVIGIGLC